MSSSSAAGSTATSAPRSGRRRDPMLLLKGHAGRVRSVAYAPDATTLASSGNDWTVRLWDLATGRARSVLVGNEVAIRSVAFAPDGRSLVSTAAEVEYYMRTSEAILWDLPSCKVRSTVTIRHNKVLSAAYAPDSRT